jgi:hypothetical protein
VSSQEALKRSLAAPERLARGDLEVEARQVTSTGHVTAYGARSVAPVERYKRRGQLTLRQVRAADLLYRAWAIMNGAKPAAEGCSAWTPSGWSDAQLAATRAYEKAQRHVGRHLWPLAFHVVCLEWSCERFANERGRNATSTLEALRYALEMAADSLGVPE